MSLKKCKECGNQISAKADACPFCGFKPKKKSVGCLGLIIIIVLIGVIWVNIGEYSEKKAAATELAKKQKADFEKQEANRKKEEAKQKVEFEKNIEQHYKNLISAYKNKSISAALENLASFEKFEKSDYKDLPIISKKLKIMDLEVKVADIPASETQENLSIYRRLLELDPKNKRYKKKVAYYGKKAEQQELRAGCDLELLKWHWGSSHSYVTAEGQVKNISGRKLERVRVLVTWYDSQRNMITSDSALIEYSPLLPGQTSPFKVIERYNPAMQKASIEFKFMFGERIPTFDRRN